MKKNVIVGIFYGESFYDITFLSEADPCEMIHTERCYSPRVPLKLTVQNALQRIAQSELPQHPEISIRKVFVCSRFVEKIFSYKLGGSVAQVVTKGFEKWLALHQETKFESDFKIEVAPDLAADEMIIGIEEKIDSSGQIILPLSDLEVEKVIGELTKKQAKRVCVHLVNSDKNSLHLNQLCEALKKKEFEVFNPMEINSRQFSNDFELWRTNLLEASTQGTLKEMNDLIQEAFKGLIDDKCLYYLDNHLKVSNSVSFSNNFALEKVIFNYLLKEQLIPENSDIFHFGNENFSLLSPLEQQWKSPWGQTTINTLKRIDLKIQPTNSFYLNSFDEIEITKSEESFEPGPMSLERGRIPCVFDILNSENLSKELHKKIKDSFWALARSSQTKHSEQKTFDEFRKLILDRLIWEVLLTSTKESLIIYGKWTEKNFAYLKSQLSNKHVLFINELEVPKSLMIAKIGMLSS